MAFANDYQDEVVAETINVLRVSASSQKKVQTFLTEMELALVADLRNSMELSPFTQTRLKAQMGMVKDTIKKFYDKAENHVSGEMIDLAKHEAAWTRSTVDDLLNVTLLSVSVTPEQLESMVSGIIVHGAPQKDWWKKQRADTRQRYQTTLAQGIFRGETNDQLVQRVRGSRNLGFSNGIMAATRREAMTLVRTSAIQVANNARLMTFDKNKDVVKGIQWVAVLDHRTTHICKSLDGLQWDNKRNPIGHNKIFPGPTAHWNCRSTQVAVTKSWAELSKEKITLNGKKQEIETVMRRKLQRKGITGEAADSVINKTRSSLDGQVSQKMNFEEWLRKKDSADPAFVDDLLGKGRVKLWRSKKITAQDLTDQTLRPLTVKELQEKFN